MTQRYKYASESYRSLAYAGPGPPRRPDRATPGPDRHASPTRATPGPDRHVGPTDYPSQTAASASVGARRAARTAG